MSSARDIATARELFEKAELEANPEFKAHALQEAVSLLASLDPEETSDAERRMIGNLRQAHTRRLLAQLVTLKSVSMDAWFDYVHLLFGELKPEVQQLVRADRQLGENFTKFVSLLGPEVAEILERQYGDNSKT